MNKTLCIAVVGPTASGKSELAVQIATQCTGAIISADSRQIYKGMNIGSGKVSGAWQNNVFMYKDIEHYLIDEVSPQEHFSAAQFRTLASQKIALLHERGVVPIICGGTGMWIDAVLQNQTFSEAPPDETLREALKECTTQELFAKLQELDPVRALSIDAKNPHRLIRALEIVITTGKPVPALAREQPYDVIWIGINVEPDSLQRNIRLRLQERLQSGMIEEVQKLHASGVSWERLESFGLEYKYCALALQGFMTQDAMQIQLATAIRQYAKRQMTWWKRNPDINWFSEASEAYDFALRYLSQYASGEESETLVRTEYKRKDAQL